MHYMNLWLCKQCSAFNLRPFYQPTLTQAVNVVRCAACSGTFTRHQCSNHQNGSEPLWLRLLETGVPSVCPACGPIYSLAKRVITTPNISPDIKAFAGGVCLLLLLAVVVKVGDTLSS